MCDVLLSAGDYIFWTEAFTPRPDVILKKIKCKLSSIFSNAFELNCFWFAGRLKLIELDEKRAFFKNTTTINIL